MTGLELLHFLAALTGLAIGSLIVLSRKGTRGHRLGGRAWIAAMVLVNSAALLSYEDGRFGVFHALALVSLATLTMGLLAIRRGKVADHAMWMSWTFAGLLAAGAGQLAVLIGLPQTAVNGAIFATIGAAYWLNNIRKLPIRAALALDG